MCKSCCATEDVAEFDGFKICKRCRDVKRKCYSKNKNEYKQARRRREPKEVSYARNADIKPTKRKLGSPFPLRSASELRPKFANEGLCKATRRFKETGQTKRQNTSRN